MATPISLPSRLPALNSGGGRPHWAHEHAANETYPAWPAATGDPAGSGPRETPRLAGAFLASLMLHLGLAIFVSSTLTFTAVKEAASPPLTVTLAQAPVTKHTGAPPPETVRDESQEQHLLQKDLGPPQQPARFLIDPDLSVLEQIPTTIPGTVSLRLYVTAQGAIERVSVIRADPVPKELIEGLVDRFGKTKLSPAMVGSQPTASTVEVTIRVDPPAQLLDIGR